MEFATQVAGQAIVILGSDRSGAKRQHQPEDQQDNKTARRRNEERFSQEEFSER